MRPKKRPRKFGPFKLTPYEQRIEDEAGRGEWKPVSKEEFRRTKEFFKDFRPNRILHMRISTAVLNGLKRKAKKRGMTYHEYVRDLLLHYASTTTPARPPKVKYISLQVGHPRRRG